jgi:hypothetical protein
VSSGLLKKYYLKLLHLPFFGAEDLELPSNIGNHIFYYAMPCIGGKMKCIEVNPETNEACINHNIS